MSGQIKVDDLFRNIGPDAAGQLRGHQRFLLWAEAAGETGITNCWEFLKGRKLHKQNKPLDSKRALNEDDLEHQLNKSAHDAMSGHDNVYCRQLAVLAISEKKNVK